MTLHCKSEQQKDGDIADSALEWASCELMEVEPNFDVELCRCQERKAAQAGSGRRRQQNRWGLCGGRAGAAPGGES